MRTDIEFLRIISAFGIVWFHSGLELGKDIAYSGLVVFLIFTSYFAVKSKRKHSFQSRAVRFLIPCVLWSAIFASLSLIRGDAVYPAHYHFFNKILSTPSIHLWYLPFAFFCVIVLDKVKKYDYEILSVLSTLIFTILMICAPIWRDWTFTSPVGQYMHALPAIFIGVTFACYEFLDKNEKRVIYFLLTLALCCVVYFNLPGITKTYIVGIVLSLVLLRKNSFFAKNEKVVELSNLTFGVYLAHPLFLLVLRHVGLTSMMLPIIAFLLSMFSIFMMFKVLPKRVAQYIA